MKQVLSLLFVLLLAVSLVSCGGKEEANSHSEENGIIDGAAPQAGETNETNRPVAQPSDSSPPANHSAEETRIQVTFAQEEFIIKMYDNPTSRDFISRLPLTLVFEEYGGFEKLSVLDNGLSTEDAPKGDDPEVGDLGYYAPWNDVNMYYKDWDYSSGLVKLGRIESDPEAFASKLQAMDDDFTVTFQRVD